MFFLVLGLGCAFLCGILTALVLQWHFFLNYLMKLPPVPPFPNEEYARPRAAKAVRDEIRKEPLPCRETHFAFNLVLNAVFSQIRFTPGIRNWLLKKIRLEIEEMLTRTTAGHLLTSVKIRSLDIGREIPSFTNIDVVKVELHPEMGHVSSVELAMDMEYKGGFKLATDADLVLGKCAALCVKVLELRGRFRLHLNEDPYPHWSFSFLQEPVMNFDVESHFQGRPLPQITSLIINQIRRTIRKKHTYPCFKLRYKPFFPVPNPSALHPEEVPELEEDFVGGKMVVTVLELAKLPAAVVPNVGELYCCVAVDDCNWVDASYRSQVGSRKSDRRLHVRSVSFGRSGDGSPAADLWPGFGVETIFVPERYSPAVVVSEVHPASAAALAGLNVGDVLVRLNGRPVVAHSHDAVERTVSGAEDAVVLVVESAVAVVGPASGSDAPGEAKPSSPSSQAVDSNEPFVDAKRSPSVTSTSSSSSRRRHAVEETAFTHRTAAVPISSEPYLNDKFEFRLEPWHSWVNVSVWTRPSADPASSVSASARADEQPLVGDVEQQQQGDGGGDLIGHASFPVSYLIHNCCQTAGGYFVEKFPLRAPDVKASKAKAHGYASFSGFHAQWCYGEVCLSFGYASPPLSAYERHLHESRSNQSATSASGSGSGSPKHSLKQRPRFGPQHSFVKAVLSSANLCAVCSKKSWWKSSYQCRSCSVACHRKCLARYRETNPVCDLSRGSGSDAVVTGPESADENDEYIVITAPGPSPSPCPSLGSSTGAGDVAPKVPEISVAAMAGDESGGSRLGRFGWRRRKPLGETQAQSAGSEDSGLMPSPKSASCSSSPRRRLGQWVSKFQGAATGGSGSGSGSGNSIMAAGPMAAAAGGSNSTVMAAIKRIGSAQSLALNLNSGSSAFPGGGAASASASSDAATAAAGLRAPSAACSATSRSLPPSPNRSPTSARKQVFARQQESVEQYFATPLEWDTSQDLRRLVSAMKSWPSQRDELVNEVKARGCGLYAGLPPKRRVAAINGKLQALQAAVDEASERRNTLAVEERDALSNSAASGRDRGGGAKTAAVAGVGVAVELASLIAEKDAEIQAYALLMLHYCAGLQRAREGLEDDADDDDDDDDEGEDDEDEDGDGHEDGAGSDQEVEAAAAAVPEKLVDFD